MRIEASDCHLTYCSNIHPGESWEEVRGNLERYLPAVKQQCAPEQKFGIGLRLSAIAANALQDEKALREFQDFLSVNDLYVFTINGFPYGAFHGTRVKEEVYLPDWQDEERLRYTNLLADLLVELLPDDPSLEGSISTVPGAFKPRVGTPEAITRMAELILRHAAYLVKLREKTGRTIALALEPEPCCFLETIEETVNFFHSHLYSTEAVTQLQELTDLEATEAQQALHRHLGICLDLCHAAVEFEDPVSCLQQLREADISVPKVQVSAGLRLLNVTSKTKDLLQPFDDHVYLHQVVERSPTGLARYLDLPQAFESLAKSETKREWRVHFHVPIFLDDLGDFSSTQFFIRKMLDLHRRQPLSKHLEVETYTWGVLPERYRGEPVETAIVRELSWVKERLTA